MQFCKQLLSFSMEIKTSSLSSQLERDPVKRWGVAEWDLGGWGSCQLGMGMRDPLFLASQGQTTLRAMLCTSFIFPAFPETSNGIQVEAGAVRRKGEEITWRDEGVFGMKGFLGSRRHSPLSLSAAFPLS